MTHQEQLSEIKKRWGAVMGRTSSMMMPNAESWQVLSEDVPALIRLGDAFFEGSAPPPRKPKRNKKENDARTKILFLLWLEGSLTGKEAIELISTATPLVVYE